MKKKESITGIMTNLIVYKDHALVGKGWVIWYDGRMSNPTLIAIDGSELPVGWYNLVATEQQLIVVNKTIQ